MNNALYYTREKATEEVLNQMLRKYELKKSYESCKETVYRSDKMLVTIAKKYIFIYLYEDHDGSLCKAMKKSFRSKV